MRRFVSLVVVILSASSGLAGERELLPSGAGYVQALRVANEFLQAWSHRDSETGLALLSDRLRSGLDEANLRQHIEGLSNPRHQAFEIGAGAQVDSTHCSFPVVIYEFYLGESDAYRAEVTLQLVRHGGDWRVDSLPPEGR
jgi:hypothetical protein